MKISKLMWFIALMLCVYTSLLTWQVTEAYITFSSWGTRGVNYRYSYYLPTSFQSPTTLGASRWNNVSVSSWIFTRVASSSNYVEYAGVDGAFGAAAVTTVYMSGNRITRFTMRYDSSESWYTGMNTPGSNQLDAWSVAAHEFGHALGLDDTQATYCSGSYNNATMCSIGQGETWLRSLETDDINAVSFLYP